MKFRPEFVGICHICSDILSRPEVRRVLDRHIDDVVARVSLHCAILERSRRNEDVMRVYTRM